ncbi:ABC transporter permease, partial [Lacticaseibacillus rhamnosus K32]
MDVIFRQVFIKNLKSKTWLWIVLGPLVLAAIFGAVFWLMNQTNQTTRIGVVSDSPALVQTFKSSSDNDQRYTHYATTAAAKRALAAEKLDAVLTVTGQPTQQASLIQRTDGQSINRTQLQGVLAQAHTKKVASQLQLSTTQLQQLFATPALATTSVKVDDGKLVTRSAKSQASGSVAGFIVGILIYTFVISYASMMAQEIGTEKGSRIEESILTAITPQAQFFGKLLGILALMATQIIIYGVVGLASLVALRQLPQNPLSTLISHLDLSSVSPNMILFSLAFFFVGTLTYTVLAALTGSLVANQEQIGQATTPIVMLGMVGYFGAIIVANGASPILNIASYVPFLSTMMMP